MIDRNLIILFVVCVVFMVYLGIEGFAAYSSYSQMLAAKYGTLKVTTGSNNEKIESIMTDDELTAKYKAMNLSGSELANAVKAAKDWQLYNANSSSDFYNKLAGEKITIEDIRKTIGTGQAGKVNDKSWVTYYDATDYSENSPDIIKTASGNYLQRRTGSRLNETSYLNTGYFKEDRAKAGGRTLKQCRSDDFNCMNNLDYANINYQGDDSWQRPFSGGFQTTATGFPIAPGVSSTSNTPSTTSAPPSSGGTQKTTPNIDNNNIYKCVNNKVTDFINDGNSDVPNDLYKAFSIACQYGV